MDAYREAAYRRSSRHAWTLARAVRAGRARAKADPGRDVAPVDGEALRDLAATVAADARSHTQWGTRVAAWLLVHVYFLVGCRNRFIVFVRWTVSFITRVAAPASSRGQPR